jgi:hypothetical protein
VPEENLNLYFSPHLDDAILSCGGLIHAQRQAGERVGVLTLCAGSPGPSALSTLAQQYESAWGESSDGMALRRAENAAILSSWGVQNWECSVGDAIYRAVKEFRIMKPGQTCSVSHALRMQPICCPSGRHR